MVDVNALLVSWLRSINALVTLLPARSSGQGVVPQSVYAVDLPAGLNPQDGPAILIQASGGLSETEVQGIANTRFQIKIIADVGQEPLCRQLYSALYDNCNGKGNVQINGIGTILSFFEITPPQELPDPDTDWATLIVFYQLIAR